MQIYKYSFTALEGELVLPEGAKILDIQLQGERFALWAIVDPGARKVLVRKICGFGTGHELPPGIDNPYVYQYITTIQAGGLAWHFFECLQ